jgi:hypothetical protein
MKPIGGKYSRYGYADPGLVGQEGNQNFRICILCRVVFFRLAETLLEL